MTAKNINLEFNNWGKVFLYSFLFLFFIAISILSWMYYLSQDLPSIEELKSFNPEQISKIIGSDGELIHKLQAVKKREVIKIGDVPQNLINALIIMEDRDFYDHSGFSFKATARAILVDIFTLSYKQGASTLTQQLARSMYDKIIWKDRSITRKVKELITAFNIEQTYTKSEILELYLNSVFLGHGRYGVQSASQLYFNKDISDLSLDECAMLVGILPAPNYYSPFSDLRRADNRKALVLKVMYENKKIDLHDYTIFLDKSLDITERKMQTYSGKAPYFNEHVRKELEKIDEDLDIDIYRDGLTIYTTIDSKIQEILEKSFEKYIKKNQEVLNKEFLENPRKLSRALEGTNFTIDEMTEILSSNTTIPKELRDKFLVQGAVVAIDPKNGNILGMIGGRQEKEYLDLHGFNRATQAKRQPGSIFKPFIYLTALENGYTPTTQLLNQPLVVFIDDTTRWNPQNHDGSTGLLTTLRHGLKKSLNLISVRIVQELITPRQVVKKAKSFNLSTKIASVNAIALGVSDVIPIEIASSYATIANKGIYNEPISITHIKDQHGRVIKHFVSEQLEVVNEPTNYIMLDMMKDVVDSGTGSKIRWKYKFNAPMAGKTGTTNNKTDAWFIGFTPQIVIGIWIGVDDPSIPLGKRQYGSVAALPIFADAIKDIYDYGSFHSGAKIVYLDNKEDWSQPNGVVEVKICTETLKKANDKWCKSTNEIYLENHMPNQNCDKHINAFTKYKK
tara:strand:- start:5237 stop:7441 length:2205 start_codon:yes stop_codon:yes gene_type:complete